MKPTLGAAKTVALLQRVLIYMSLVMDTLNSACLCEVLMHLLGYQHASPSCSSLHMLRNSPNIYICIKPFKTASWPRSPTRRSGSKGLCIVSQP